MFNGEYDSTLSFSWSNSSDFIFIEFGEGNYKAFKITYFNLINLMIN
jgi:hypothetical protein